MMAIHSPEAPQKHAYINVPSIWCRLELSRLPPTAMEQDQTVPKQQEHQLRPTQSSHSAAASASTVFVTASPAGTLDALGLPPVPKAHSRPHSGRRKSKPSALDKHLRHVVLLQHYNRARAQQHAAATHAGLRQRQRFADWSHRLRTAILHRGDNSSSNSPAQPLKPAPAAAAEDQHQQASGASAATDSSDLIRCWQPAAAAAQVRQLQEQNALQHQQLRSTLPTVLDPDSLRPGHCRDTQQQQGGKLAQGGTGDLALRHKAATSGAAGAGTAGAGAAAGAKGDDGDGGLDVDAFLDSLLLRAAAGALQPASSPAAAGKPKQAHVPAHAAAAAAAGPGGCTQQASNQAPRGNSRCQSRPAWAVPEAAAASAAAAAGDGAASAAAESTVAAAASGCEAAEEAELLSFAEGLEWGELLQDLGDDELADAFQALELADAAAADGQPGADKAWRASFVTALNAAAMKGIANTQAAGAAAGGGGAKAAGAGSQQGDKHSCVSSASAIRRAEAAAARRQQLMQRLQRITGLQLPAAAARATAGAGAGAAGRAGGADGAGAGSCGAPSVCGSTCSRLGPVATGDAAAAGDSWDSSTVVSSAADDVGQLRAAVHHLEASEVMADNPQLFKGVHSTASVRSMICKLEGSS